MEGKEYATKLGFTYDITRQKLWKLYKRHHDKGSTCHPANSAVINMHVAPIFPHLTSLIQLTVEPQSLQTVASCSLTPTQQKVQWWCFIATQALCQKERWPQCVGVTVNGTPTQEVWTALLQVCSEKLCSPSWEPAKQILLCFKFIMHACTSKFLLPHRSTTNGNFGSCCSSLYLYTAVKLCHHHRWICEI